MSIDRTNPDFAPFQMDGTTLVKVLDPKVKQVVIPDGVTIIGDHAFFRCNRLTAVDIPDSVREIGVNAFGYCSALKDIHLPNSITHIAMQAFSHCTSLETIQLPASIQGILSDTFRDSGLKHIDIPNTVKEIGVLAFGYCTRLKEIDLPNSITNIAMDAFTHCSSLETIHLPESMHRIPANTFSSCGLVEIDLPHNLRTIGNSAFSGCTSLETIRFPENLQKIADRAFMGCSSLTAINLPKGLSKIGEFAFHSCGLHSIRGGNKHMVMGKSMFFSEDKKGRSLAQSVSFIEPYFFHELPMEIQVSYCETALDTQTKSELDALFAYLDSQTQLKHLMFQKRNTPLIARLLQGKEPVALLFLEEYIKKSIQEGCTELTAMFLAYKNQHYSSEERDAYEERQFLLELCMETPTYDEFSKKWECSLEHGEVTIYGYIGTSFVEMIPKVLADGNLVRYFKCDYRRDPDCMNNALTELVVEADFLEFETYSLPKELKILRFTGRVEKMSPVFPLADLEHLTLPDGLTLLPRGMFSPLQNIQTLTIPFSVKKIELGALPHVQGCVVYGEAHSFVERYCLKNGFTFSLLEE